MAMEVEKLEPGASPLGGLESADPLERLLDVVVGREETLGRALHVLELADKRGILNLTADLLEDFDEIIEGLIGVLTKPDPDKLFANGGALLKAAKAFDVNALPTLAQGAAEAMKRMADPNPSPQIHGAWDLMKVLKDPDVSRALSAMMAGLKGLGAALRAAERSE
ncbi:DUF1641 domain-containing protein [Alicyclobacillaceae bacterium I2511]|nr:DUF1641 domain-containing protein [Alicyclobacillaceae bacterium I2511]